VIARAASRRIAIAVIGLTSILALCLGVCGCGGESGGGSESGETEAVESGSVDMDLAGETGLPVLLDLGSTTCVPCKTMAPILDEMRETFAGQFDVRFVNVKEDATLAREYGVRIIPTQIYLDEQGNELFRHQGFFSREGMLAAWGELGYVFEE
jgi:thioredoxin 1